MFDLRKCGRQRMSPAAGGAQSYCHGSAVIIMNPGQGPFCEQSMCLTVMEGKGGVCRCMHALPIDRGHLAINAITQRPPKEATSLCRMYAECTLGALLLNTRLGGPRKCSTTITTAVYSEQLYFTPQAEPITTQRIHPFH